VTVANGPATMTALLPVGTFTSGVAFTVQSVPAAQLTPSAGTDGSSNPVIVSPVAAYQFVFAIPTLNADATLTFDISVAALDAMSRSTFLAAVESNAATLGVLGDAAGSAFQAFDVCSDGGMPTAGGCVVVERLDATGTPIPTGDPTEPATVRFTGVVGHFSTYGVVIVTPIPDTTAPVISGVPAPIVAEAASPAGAVVLYALPTGVDDRDGPVAVTCAPPPASLFPVGTTTVTCTTADRAGNTSAGSFSVTVVSPQRRIAGSGYNHPEAPAYRATFSVDATGPFSPAGSVKYSYTRTRMTFASTSITAVSVNGTTFTIEGTGSLNGVPGYTFTAVATDGSPDSFGIVIRRPDGTVHYATSSATLAGGALAMTLP
jgi:hypothetical protein